MAGSAFDWRSYALECPRCHVIETIALRKLKGLQSLRCSACSYLYDLSQEPHQTALAKEFAAAEQEDRDRGMKDSDKDGGQE
jgi:Zn ribbon nucleic-acid-binding protein